MSWGKLILAAAISISLILAITLLAVCLELEKIRAEILEVGKKLAAVRTEVNSIERAYTDSVLIVSTEILFTCGNTTFDCGKIYTYAGSPALLPLSSCTAVEVKGNGSAIEVVSVPALGMRGDWELKICRNGACAPSGLLQSLWGGERLILSCKREPP